MCFTEENKLYYTELYVRLICQAYNTSGTLAGRSSVATHLQCTHMSHTPIEKDERLWLHIYTFVTL